MDDDSVDSETENRLFISTTDSLTIKDTSLRCRASLSSLSEDGFDAHQEETYDWVKSPVISDIVYSAMESSDITALPATKFSDEALIASSEGSASEKISNVYQPEEGELEEGELEDDDEASESFLQDEPSKAPSVEVTTKDTFKPKGKDGRKRTRDKDEDKRRKRRKHHKDDEQSSKNRKTHYPKEEKVPDFDALLKEELYLRGEASTPEVYQNEEGMETGESGSSEEWDKSGRKRHRKKHSSRSKSKSPSRKNEAICMFFLQGNCQKGNGCPYSHEMAPTRKLELCKFYMVDRCAKREKCLYMHKDFPCKYYHFGMKCVAGEDCKFSHNCLQEPAKNILCKHIESAPKDILGDFPRLAKNIAMSVLTLTLDKRKGIIITDEALQSVLEVEGRGFKYVDRSLKTYRKRNGIEKVDKVDDKDKMNKESVEKSPKKSSKSKHKGDDKEHGRRSSKDRSKPRSTNRDDKDRDNDRRHNRVRDRRDRPERSRSRTDAPPVRGQKSHPYPLGGTQRQRDFFQRIDNINLQEAQEDGALQDPDQQRDPPFDQPTKWYSSDEENDQVHDRYGGGFSQNDGRKRGENDFPSEQPNFEISQTPDLKNIDFNYIQQLLNKVQPPNIAPSERYDNSYHNANDYRTNPNTENFSCELKDVFEPNPKPAAGSRNLTLDLQNLIKTAREKSAVPEEQYPRDMYSDDVSRDPRKAYQESRQISLDPRQATLEARQLSPFNEKPRSLAARDPRFNRQNSSWKPEQQPCSAIEDEEDRQRSQESFSGALEDSRTNVDVDMRSVTGLSRQSESGSMYDVDLRQLDAISSAEIDDINSLILKVPTHTPAKEIDGSIHSNSPIHYRLIEVSVQKPDFSNLKGLQADPRYLDDPRVRLMFRRKSAEEQSPSSPRTVNRKDSTEYSSTPEGSDRTEVKESRDPRKQPQRDPRAEGKLMKATIEPRVDPRMAGRGDPRGFHSREPMMDSYDMEEHCDPSMTGPMFINGHMDNSLPPNFNSMGPILPQPFAQMDPRGRPGLLGPAPGHGMPMSMQGGPMGPGPGIHRPPFLLATPRMNPMNYGREQEDVMMGPPGGMPKGQMWDAGASYKDPRVTRDSRQSY